MKCSLILAIGTQLAAIASFAETQPHTYTYTGDIVNANCMQAANIVSRNSHGYVPSRATSAFTGARSKPLNTVGMRKSILQHCTVNPGSTQFALLGDDGNFFKLDEKG